MKKPLLYTKDHKVYSSKHHGFVKAHESGYGKKYFNEKVKVKSPDDLLGKNVEPAFFVDDIVVSEPAEKVLDYWKNWSKWDYGKEMKIHYANSTTTTATYTWGSSNVSGNYYQPLYWGEYKKQIGEAPEMIIPASSDMTLSKYHDEYQKEIHAFQKVSHDQAMKLKEEYQHEQLAYQKQCELEQQKEDMPIFSVEFTTARVFLQYYANLALQKPAPTLKPEQIMQVSKYLAATISCELRHRKRKCSAFWSRGLYLWDMLDTWSIDEHKNRRDAGKRFLSETEDWDNFMVEQYLKLGAYIFGGSWEGGFGGWPWASVAWYAGDWVYSALNNKGNIPLILWEKMLNAAHNNGRWMNKLGMGNVMGVLNMGANADPSFIAETAKKALIVDNPNDFKRIIEKWTSCDLPGEKNKLELPNPGVIVDTSKYRNQKKSYLPIIKEQEAKLKAQEVEASLVIDAPDKAPIELGVKEEAVEIEASASLKMKVDKVIQEQLSEQQKMQVEALKKSIKEKQGELKKSKNPEILATGIKLPWKGPKNPLKAPHQHDLAFKDFTYHFYHQVFGEAPPDMKPDVKPEDVDFSKAEIKGAPKHDFSKHLEEMKEALLKKSSFPEPHWSDQIAQVEILEGSKQPQYGSKPSMDAEFSPEEVSTREPKDKGGTHEQVAAG